MFLIVTFDIEMSSFSFLLQSMSDEEDRGKASTANLITLKELNLLFRNGFGPGLRFKESNATSSGNTTAKIHRLFVILAIHEYFSWE